MNDAELKGLLGKLLDKVETLATRVETLATKVETLPTREELSAAVSSAEARLTAKIDKVEVEVRILGARLDEQRQTINALIPTRVAVVPPAAE